MAIKAAHCMQIDNQLERPLACRWALFNRVVIIDLFFNHYYIQHHLQL